MKRRTKASTSDEWVDLVQAESSEYVNQKTRNDKVSRQGVATALVLALMFLYSLSKHLYNQTHPYVNDRSGRHRKVVLLGPHDRYNDFGDILAERLLSKLLVDRAGFVYNKTDDRANTLLLGGIVTRDDMDHHGLSPKKTIYSMKSIQDMSREDLKLGPYDIVFTGGSGEGPGDEGPSILYEKHKDAVEFLETESLRSSANADRVYDCPYLFPKELLLPVVDSAHAINVKKHLRGRTMTLPRPKKNFAIVDSLETPQKVDEVDKLNGKSAPPLTCRRVAAKADHLGFRSSKPFAPDSTIMAKEILGDEIDRVFREEVLNSPEFGQFAVGNSSAVPYIAVQHETAKHMSDASYSQDLADALDELSRNLGNALVIFFPAGRVGRPVGDHVAFALSREVSEMMKQPSFLYEAEHALKIAALISRATAVLSTNLHVHILSFVYQKPRAILHGGTNHQSFLDMWEAKDVASMGMISSVGDSWNKGLSRFFAQDETLINQEKSKGAYKNAITHYERNFNTWSKLLVTPTDINDNDDDSVV